MTAVNNRHTSVFVTMAAGAEKEESNDGVAVASYEPTNEELSAEVADILVKVSHYYLYLSRF